MMKHGQSTVVSELATVQHTRAAAFNFSAARCGGRQPRQPLHRDPSWPMDR